MAEGIGSASSSESMELEVEVPDIERIIEEPDPPVPLEKILEKQKKGREAAKKCRDKKATLIEKLTKENQDLQNQNQKIEEQLKQLQDKKQQLLELIQGCGACSASYHSLDSPSYTLPPIEYIHNSQWQYDDNI